jgi:hypothetical protein
MLLVSFCTAPLTKNGSATLRLHSLKIVPSFYAARYLSNSLVSEMICSILVDLMQYFFG